MLRTVIVAASALWALMAAPAMAAAVDTGCDLELQSSSGQWRIEDIDLFSQQARGETFQLQLINSGTGQCVIHLDFDTTGAPFGLVSTGSNRIPYQLVDHGSGKDITPDKGLRVNYPGIIKVDPQSTVTLDLEFIVFPQFTTDGIYTQGLRISADGAGNNAVHVERLQTLVATIASSATMSLSGSFTRTGSLADVDLGAISGPGPVSLPLYLKVRSSRAYRIDATSQNQGKLVLDGTGWSIAYGMSINGVSVSPAGGRYHSTPGPYRRLETLPLGFDIIGSTDVAAGRYSDLVTLTIAVD